MTAEVNSPAAACPHAGGASPASKKPSEESCGFGSQMMNIARHAAAGGEWEVTGSVRNAERLSQDRQVSSIPKSDFTPMHQSSSNPYWEYPSEDMYFKAMQRKGWDPEATQMKTIVAIHNTVNEQSWREVLQWEAMHAYVLMAWSLMRRWMLLANVSFMLLMSSSGQQAPPKLKKFIGRPKDFSPKARFLNLVGWYNLFSHAMLLLLDSQNMLITYIHLQVGPSV